MLSVAYQYFGGVRFIQHTGVSYSTVLTLMSEVGKEGFEKFPSAKHFALGRYPCT